MDDPVLFDRATVAKNWHSRGFSCGTWIDHAGREWSHYAHETDELFMMMSGELVLEVEGQSIQPAVGEEIRIPPGTHIIRNIGGKTARWLYGQLREPETATWPETGETAPERSFHPVLKRKRRLEKRTTPLEAQKSVCPPKTSFP